MRPEPRAFDSGINLKKKHGTQADADCGQVRESLLPTQVFEVFQALKKMQLPVSNVPAVWWVMSIELPN